MNYKKNTENKYDATESKKVMKNVKLLQCFLTITNIISAVVIIFGTINILITNQVTIAFVLPIIYVIVVGMPLSLWLAKYREKIRDL